MVQTYDVLATRTSIGLLTETFYADARTSLLERQVSRTVNSCATRASQWTVMVATRHNSKIVNSAFSVAPLERTQSVQPILTIVESALQTTLRMT